MRVTGSVTRELSVLLGKNDATPRKTNKKGFANLGGKDSFVRNYYDMPGIRSSNSGVKGGRVTSSILDMINFNYKDIWRQKGDKLYSFLIGGKEYLKSEIPAVSVDRCEEIKAVNNTVDFSNDRYYKYTEKDGRIHIFSCVDDHVSQPYSDLVSGRQSDASYQVTKFWNMLSRDGTYMGLYFSEDRQRQMLNDAGITNGFFKVKVGDHQQEYFLSHGNAGVAVRKFEYDATYDMFAKRGTALFNKYEVGSVFKVSGKEYVLKEDRTLDIPYGEDIFDIQFPKSNML